MNSIRLLLVEDEALILTDLEHVLIDAGFEVFTAMDGDEALSVLDTSGRELAGLITDIRIGDGPNGWDVARRAREIMPSLPVVYVSGDSAPDWCSQGVPNSEMLHKPFAASQFITAISGRLNQAAKGIH